MNVHPVDGRVTHSLSDLAALHSGQAGGHISYIFFDRHIRHVAHEGGNALREGFRRNDMNIAALCHAGCLLRSHDNVLVVWQDINVFCSICSSTSRKSWVLGFMVWPPEMMWVAPRPLKISESPSPLQTTMMASL